MRKEGSENLALTGHTEGQRETVRELPKKLVSIHRRIWTWKDSKQTKIVKNYKGQGIAEFHNRPLSGTQKEKYYYERLVRTLIVNNHVTGQETTLNRQCESNFIERIKIRTVHEYQI